MEPKSQQELEKEAIARKRYLKWIDTWPKYRPLFYPEIDLTYDQKAIDEMYGSFSREWRIKQKAIQLKNDNKSK